MIEESQPASEPGVPRSRRVLVVDDDRLQLKLSVVRLKNAGFTVFHASNARQALELAVLEPLDAIMSDVVMGDIDGFGLCRRLRELPTLARVPIVLLSAHYGDPGARELATRVGASALVGRTPEFDAELYALRKVLGQERPSQAPPGGPELYEAHLRSTANQLTKLVGEAKGAEDRYRALFENASDAIAVLDRSGVILEANERWRAILDTPPIRLIGRHLFATASRGHDTTSAELSAAIKRGSGRVQAAVFVRPDGGTAYLDFSITVIEMAGTPLVLAIGRDVTGPYLAARALTAAEEKYRSLVERMPDVVWTSSGLKCTFATDNVERLTGFTPEEIYDLEMDSWLERVHPDDVSRVADALSVLDRDDEPGSFDLEYRFRRKDKTWAWLWHRTIANYERAGLRYSDGLISDITLRKDLEESLRQSQKIEALGQLTGGIAHDFNNILATILANSQFLIDSLSTSDPRLEDAEEIKIAAERAASLTRQLLAFSRKQVLEFRDTDLNRLITSTERMLRRLLNEDIELTVVLEPELGHAQVDAGQIEQVVMNLAVNARDAMPMGGRLTIETRNVELDGADGAPRRYIVIAVTDTGCGMSADTQRRMFEPFFTTKELGTGTGLGLAICHGIVSQSGGYLEVTSELGRGSV
ncbi:MAG TPA: PAS domain S-box protein, partial [Polyangiaceae bacterium]|nr:PAS domain S-box protein [Polyangiaceae bacterium]